jgi:hypothetical protein
MLIGDTNKGGLQSLAFIFLKWVNPSSISVLIHPGSSLLFFFSGFQ